MVDTANNTPEQWLGDPRMVAAYWFMRELDLPICGGELSRTLVGVTWFAWSWRAVLKTLIVGGSPGGVFN